MGAEAATSTAASLDGIVLGSERLLLRPFDVADAPFVLALFTDEGFLKFSTFPPFNSIDEAHALIARDASKRATGERLRLGIQRVADGALIGYCDVFSIDRNRLEAEIGYGLLTIERGCGWMGEALLVFLGDVFQRLQLRRVVADIHPSNTNSEKLLQRMGFIRQGPLPENGGINAVWPDSVIYVLHNPNALTNYAPPPHTRRD